MADMDGIKAGQKRKRVAFDNSTPSEADGGPLQPKRNRTPGGRTEPSGPQRMDDFDDAEGETKVVEAEGDDDDDEDDGERLEAAGGLDFGAGGRKKKVQRPDDDDDDDEEGGGGSGGGAEGGRRKVKKILQVRGEVAELEVDFNEAGEAIEPFHLRAERSEGYFDEGGNYHFNRVAADRDEWLAELDDMDPRERQRLQASARAHHASGSTTAGGAGAGAGSGKTVAVADDGEGEGEGDDKEDGAASDSGSEAPPTLKADLLKTIVSLLQEGETVSAALIRLSGRGGGGSKHKGGSSSSAASAEDKKAFNKLTEAADALVSAGMVDLYGSARRALIFELKEALEDAGASAADIRAAVEAPPAAAATAAPAAPAAPAVPVVYSWLPDGTVWEYTTAPPDDSAGADAGAGAGAAAAQTFGPFPAQQMNGWIGAGYFSAQMPYVRQVAGDGSGSGSGGSQWQRLDAVVQQYAAAAAAAAAQAQAQSSTSR